MPSRYGLRSQKNPATSASMADQSDHGSNQAAAAESPVTMGALQAMMDSFKLEMRAMIAESRSRSSSSAPQQPSSPSSNQATQSATQSITVQPAAEDKSTTRKGVVYLVGYPIPYRPILFHERISRGLTLDLL